MKWMNESYFESTFAIFDEKPPFFVYFEHFLGTFPIWPVSMICWPLNWTIYWIESAEFSLNWIIFWSESWIEYWMNHFLAKFKHWLESDRVSKTPTRSSVKPVAKPSETGPSLIFNLILTQKNGAQQHYLLFGEYKPQVIPTCFNCHGGLNSLQKMKV